MSNKIRSDTQDGVARTSFALWKMAAMARRRCGAMKKGRNLRIPPPFPCHWASGAPPDWWPSTREGRAAPRPDRWAWVWWDPGPEPEKIASTFSDGELTERPTSGHTHSAHKHNCTIPPCTHHTTKNNHTRRANSLTHHTKHTHTLALLLQHARQRGRGETIKRVSETPNIRDLTRGCVWKRETDYSTGTKKRNAERGTLGFFGCVCVKNLPGTTDGIYRRRFWGA